MGVDFGTSFTNVYYKGPGQPQVLTLSPLPLQVTEINYNKRMTMLYEYFMLGEEKQFPLSTVATIRGSKGGGKPVFDGRVYIPEKDIKAFDPQATYIKTNLKWETDNLIYNRLFINHLALLIIAEAATQDIRKIEWVISYPSAFAPKDKNLYRATWDRIIRELEKKTGIDQIWLASGKGDSLRTEGLALAQYFADPNGGQDWDLLYTTCIDMGGGTSDISIWFGNNLIHQCSIQLAGRDLFSQFMRQKVDFISQQFDEDLSELAHGSWQDFNVKLDALLMEQGEEWLREKRAFFDDDSDLQEVLSLTSLGIAGLYYYVGIILAALQLEGKHHKEENTPVYIGGNGSRIFHWLSNSGEFNRYCEAHDLFSLVLSKASRFPDTQEETRLSPKPKAEVACGLVLDQKHTKLKGLERNDDNAPFAGEDCEVNQKPVSDTDRLSLEGQIQRFEIPELHNLKDFVANYHQALKELKVQTIQPLECYRHEDDQREEDRKKLWKAVERRIENAVLRMQGNAEDIREEPPFILALKELLHVLNEGGNGAKNS